MSKLNAIAPGAWRRYQAVSASAADMIAEAATGITYGVNCQCIDLPLSCLTHVCQNRFQHHYFLGKNDEREDLAFSLLFPLGIRGSRNKRYVGNDYEHSTPLIS